MARLKIDRARKYFGSYTALDDVSIDVEDGEFIAVLGPSGCGKTTLLRQIAGFDKLDGGEITIGDRLLSSPERHVPPEHRKLGIVFQSYALWPHMSVAENVAYGLTVAGVRDPERARRVAAALDLVGLTGFAERRPGLLSKPEAGHCKVDVLGVEAVMRCRSDQAASAQAKICLRARDFSIAQDEGGLAARVERLSYQGGYFRMEVRPLASEETVLHLDAPEPAPAAPGETIRLSIRDGWVIPEADLAA